MMIMSCCKSLRPAIASKFLNKISSNSIFPPWVPEFHVQNNAVCQGVGEILRALHGFELAVVIPKLHVITRPLLKTELMEQAIAHVVSESPPPIILAATGATASKYHVRSLR